MIPLSQTSEREPRRPVVMSRAEAEMWVGLMGRREAERYYPGILALVKWREPMEES